MPRKVGENHFGLVEGKSHFLEQEEIKLVTIRFKLAIGESQLDKGQFIDGEDFIRGLLRRYQNK